MGTGLDASFKFDQAAAALERLSGPDGLLGQLEQLLGVTGEALYNYRQIHAAVVRRMVPLIRRELDKCFSASGLDKNSTRGKGGLYKAAVLSALIEATPHGIYIHFGSGFDASVYARGGQWQYGAVRGPREKRQVRDWITGARNGPERVTSVLGQRAKRSIKRAVLGGKKVSKRSRDRIENPVIRHIETRLNGKVVSDHDVVRRGVSLGEVTVIKPRPFYTLSAAQKKFLEDAYIRFWQEEATKLLKRLNSKQRRAS